MEEPAEWDLEQDKITEEGREEQSPIGHGCPRASSSPAEIRDSNNRNLNLNSEKQYSS